LFYLKFSEYEIAGGAPAGCRGGGHAKEG